MSRLTPIFAAAIAFVLGIGATLAWTRYRNSVPTPSTAASAEKPLYWYDPMAPDKHFDAPGKSPFMDMQLVPKYANSESAPGTIAMDPRLAQNLGVRTATAERGALQTKVRATGAVAFDERAVSLVQSRVGGIVEQLHVRAPLTQVTSGQPLLTVLAPDWTAAQEEYLALRRSQTAGLENLRNAARLRLVLLGMGEGQIRVIERSGRAQTRITLNAPRAGVVAELNVRDGATIAPGMPLMRINSLDDIWINAAIPEAQSSRAAAGAPVEARVPAFPGETFAGKIETLLPEVDAATRTLTARTVLANPQHKLTPGMYASLDILPTTAAPESVLIPSEAVIATGLRNVVLVDTGHGHYRAQEVRLGDEADGKTVVLEGVRPGENIVLSGQFLIDSEASLTGTLARLEGGGKAAPTEKAPTDSAAETSEQHLAQGIVERVEGNRCTIDAGAIPSLGMDAMTMTFACPANLVRNVRAGQHVSFRFFRNAERAFEITKIAAPDANIEANGAKP